MIITIPLKPNYMGIILMWLLIIPSILWANSVNPNVYGIILLASIGVIFTILFLNDEYNIIKLKLQFKQDVSKD